MNSGFLTTPSWKKTALGTDVVLHASAPLAQLRGLHPIVLIGGVHGDEPEGVVLAEQTLAWLRQQPADRVAPWILIPCLNVDGYRQKTRVNGRGVDLNRNYPSRDWQSTCSQPRYFPGPSAASESEVQGVVELVQGWRPRLLIHCHSWNPCIVASGPPGLADARRLAASCGYQVQEEIGYPTPGSLSSYAWKDHGIPVICVEEQDKLGDLSVVWPRFASGMQAIFRDHSLRQGDSRG